MPAALIIAAILTLAVIFQVKNNVYPSLKPAPSPVMTSAPTPTELKPTSVLTPTKTPTPRVTNRSLSPTPTKPAATPQNYPLVTPTKVIQTDTQAPVFEWMTGPGDGSTVAFKNFCFPMKINDNSGGAVWVRYSFDNSGPSDWNQNFAPCYNNVPNGFHFFVVQAKDAAGNLSGTLSRNFTVNVPVPNTITPMPTSIVNETPDQ